MERSFAGHLRIAALRAFHALLLFRLRIDAWFARRSGRGARHRIAVTACWRFPIYSQTFVQQEVAALARAGFAVRFFYAELAPRSELSHACADLWSLKRRVLLHRETGAADLAHYRRRLPDRVAALAQRIADAAGIAGVELESQEHFLHAFSFTRAVEAWGADYIHSYFFYEQTLFALVAAELLDLPRGVSCYADHMLADYPFKLVPLHMRTCGVIVATSRRIRSELECLHGSPLAAVLVKPNAVDASGFAAGQRRHPGSPGPLRLLSVSRIDPKKGLEYLVDAVRILRNREIAVQATVVGAPNAHLDDSVAYDAALRESVARLGLEGAVRLIGQRDSAEVRRLLANCDVFVAPSVELDNGDKDGIPTSVLEAMAAGCAIVTTDAGSIREVIEDGVDGVLVGQKDADALAGAIARLAHAPELASRLGDAAFARVRREFDVAVSESPFHERVRHAILAHGQNTSCSGSRP